MSKGIILSLCDYTGAMVKPWLANGYDAIIVDPQHTTTSSTVTEFGTTITRVAAVIDSPVTWQIIRENISRIVFLAGFPPCTDLAVSGARWFESKAEKDEAFQFRAMQVVWQCYDIAQMIGCPFMIENPRSRISTFWRKPDYDFNPYQFTVLCDGDNYTKLTCLWTGNGYQHPAELYLHPEVASAIDIVTSQLRRMVSKREALEAFPDSKQVKDWYPDNRIHDCPPGDERANFRSATPMGFALAVQKSNDVATSDVTHHTQEKQHEETRNDVHHRDACGGVNLPVSGADNHIDRCEPVSSVLSVTDKTRPFLKWAGGKYSVLSAIAPFMPAGKRLIEPFVGAGSIFQNFSYPSYLLADINDDLINLYRQLQSNAQAVIECAKPLVEGCASNEGYLLIRDEFNGRKAHAARHAALFLALNRTCFNGLSRYNNAGVFNVGWNKKPGTSQFPLAELTRFPTRKAAHEFTCAHFTETLAQAGAGDVVFCDPPYEPLPDTGGFVSYGKDGFSFDEQILLAETLVQAHQRGARIVVTNSRAPKIIDLYMSHGFTINRLEARRSISCDASKRGNVFDIIATL